ncbi:MAG TPA: tetratricopeptide repeat protein [Candidatus Eisenbacteria bacterium]|nr:tetratricopeptide repeat protein [Candidatus Eisenbacteria bacterium]
MRAALLLVLALGTTGAGWLDPHATARQASKLYADGKFDDAVAKYNEALVDDPDSALLHLNLGAAAYRQGKFDDAINALGQVPSSDTEPARTARAAYDTGNAKYRLGAAAETSDPKTALERWAEALVAYRRAMGADPADEDAKFNHEFVEKKIADLKKKLEEQQKNKDQQQQQDQKDQKQQQGEDQQQQQQQAQDQQQQQQRQHDQQQEEQADKGQDQQQQQDQQDQRQPGEQKEKEQKQKEQEQAQGGDDQEKPGDQKPQQAQGEPGEPQGDQRQAQGGGATAGGEPTKEMSPHEAEALLDAQRDQEVRPDEIVQQLQGAGVAEPREDW